MSYTRKLWVDRVSEYPTRRILTDTSTGTSQQVTVQRSEGTVTTNGDSFDAETMNDFEGRIASAFTTDEAAIGTLSNLQTTEKTNLVGAINEVKSSVPTSVPRSLSELSDVNLSETSLRPGEVLMQTDDSTGDWVNGFLAAEKVVYSPPSSWSSTYNNVQDAIDQTINLIDLVNIDVDLIETDITTLQSDVSSLKSEKADLISPEFTGTPMAPTQAVGNSSTRIATTEFVNNEIAQDTQYHAGDSAAINGAIYPFLQQGGTVRVFVPLSKPIGSDVTTITQTGNWEIRTYNGTAIATGHPLSYYGTVSFTKNAAGVGINLTNLNSYWDDATRYTVGVAYANAGNKLNFAGTSTTSLTSASLGASRETMTLEDETTEEQEEETI